MGRVSAVEFGQGQCWRGRVRVKINAEWQGQRWKESWITVLDYSVRSTSVLLEEGSGSVLESQGQG